MNVPVLVYHKVAVPPENETKPNTYVTPARFAAQMALLSFLGYETVTLSRYFSLISGIQTAGAGKPLLLTFDDASLSVAENARPVMVKYGFTGSLFAVPSLLGGKCAWDGEGQFSPQRLMTARELAEIQKQGWEIASHSLTHRDLTAIAPHEAALEIKNSKTELERLLGAGVNYFAYPYGRFNSFLKEKTSEAGYTLAFATETGDGSSMAVPRRIISGRNGLIKFFLRLAQAGKLSKRVGKP